MDTAPKDEAERQNGKVKEEEQVKEKAGVGGGVSDSVSLDNVTAWQWLFTPEDVACTPSVVQSGLTVEQERFNRWKGVQLIFRIGDYMRLGNHATCTAAFFFQRFYMRKAMPPLDASERPHDTYTFQEMAPTCIFLACKVEETHRKLHGIVEATMAVLDRTQTGIERAEAHVYRADVTSRDYRRWKDIALLHEERLLETLCFDMIIEQPHPIAIKACQRIGTSRDVAQLTIVLLNSILYGTVCMYSDAATLAACAFLKACQYIGKNPDSFLDGTKYADRRWFEAFDVDEEEVNDSMAAIDDHLTYHHERIAPAIAAVQSNTLTPQPVQHAPIARPPSSALAMSDPSMPSSSSSANESHLKHTNFSHSIPSRDPLSSSDDRAGAAEMVTEENGSGEAERESPKDVFRPLSRHGSKSGLTGPPPPLSASASKETTAEVYVMRSPKTMNEGAPVDNTSDPHAEANAQKIEHEQAKQEDGAELEASKNQGTEESEEEGAL